MRISVILFSFLLFAAPTFAQTHHALTGSRYAGSLGMYQNPASTLSSADTTDLSIANLHLNNFTNYINSGYAPLLSKNPAISIKPSIGDYPRELITNLHLNLLSFKHKLNQKTAFGFGINLRSMINVITTLPILQMISLVSLKRILQVYHSVEAVQPPIGWNMLAISLKIS
jgi:hypothetical protein